MTDVVAKLEALSKKSLARSAIDKQAAADQRKAAWSAIQAKSPELAQFMTDFNQAFGKPATITIEIDGEVIVNQGAQAGSSLTGMASLDICQSQDNSAEKHNHYVRPHHRRHHRPRRPRLPK